MSTVEIQHGTYAAYQVERKLGLPTCEDCRQALRDYMRAYRQRPATKLRESWRNDARVRALERLRRMHPTTFRVLYEEELDR